MAFLLDRLNAAMSMVSNGKPSQQFQRLWQKTVEKIEEHEETQDAIINRIRRVMSHTEPTTILRAVESGGSVSITVLDHTRIYADGTTLSITGGAAHTGKSPSTWYACYYDDTTLADTTPTFVFTTEIKTAQAAKADGRHFCGLIFTPAAASAATVESGGVYAAGGNAVGGEIQP